MRSAFALLLLTGLAGVLPAADEKMPESDYYPLAVGTTWLYRVGDNRFLVKVTEVKAVDGKPRAKMEVIVDGKTVSYEDIGITKDGVVRYTSKGREAKPPIEFLKLPPKADVTWKVDSEVIDTPAKSADPKAEAKPVKLPVKGTFKAGKEESVTVPYGTLKAVTVTGQDVEANGVKINIVYYFTKDVGLVKQVIEMANQPKVVVELENFTKGAAK